MSENVFKVHEVLCAATFYLDVIQYVRFDFCAVGITLNSADHFYSDYSISFNVFTLKRSTEGTVAQVTCDSITAFWT